MVLVFFDLVLKKYGKCFLKICGNLVWSFSFGVRQERIPLSRLWYKKVMSLVL